MPPRLSRLPRGEGLRPAAFRSLGLLVAQGAAILVLYPTTGPVAGATTALFALAAGWFEGVRRGMLLSALLQVETALILHLFGNVAVVHPLRVVLVGGVIAIFLGGAAGWAGDVRRRLEGSERSFRLLFEESPVPMWVADPQGARILDVNRAALEKYGYDREAFLAISLREILVPGEEIGSDPGAPACRQERHRLRSGRIIDVEATSKPVLFHGRRALVTIVTDLTERREAEERFQRTERLGTLGALVAGVAHEINNPLTYMQGSAELARMSIEEHLERERDPATRETLVGLLKQEDALLKGIDQIGRITRSLKQVARAADGARRPLEVNAVVSDAAMVGQPRLSSQAELVLDLQAARPALASASEIIQVVLNLLLNAMDAVGDRPGGRVTVRTRDHGSHVRIEVEDNGDGIPEAVRDRLFTPFFTTKPHGTGLGLSLSARIAEAHGGRLGFTSREGVGTTFHLDLPVHEAEARRTPGATPAPRAHEE